jgi:hypothetical protein
VVAYPEDGALCFEHTFEKDCFYRNGERICLNHSDLGDATAEYVVKGKTFTTAAGVKIEGTMDVESGVELPELNETAEPEEVFSGKEYIDGEGRKKTGSFTIDEELTEQDLLIAQIANALQGKAIGSLTSLPPLENRAEPGDIVSGKTLYDDNGQIVIGTMETVESEELEPIDDGSGNVKFSHMATYNRYVPAWNSLTITSPLDKFGDASPNDVRKGVFFTSTSGVKIEGTMEAADVMEVESLSEIHYWTKNFAGNPYEEVYIRNGIYLGNIGNTIQYADDIAISGGSVVLANPKEYTITSKASDADAVLLGKYIKTANVIYRIPTDAPITYAAATQWTSAHLNAGFGYKINVVQAVINTIVLSKDIAAYPENGEQDGFTYSYQGTIPRDTDGASMSVDGETLIFEGTATIENDTLIL